MIDVHACGLNHSDLDSRAGTSRWPFTMPWVLGAEFAGTVAAGRRRGRGHRGRRPGDGVPAVRVRRAAPRVRSWRGDLCERFVVLGTDRFGGYAERVSVPARAVIPLRSSREFVLAAAAQCNVSTAWSMVTAVADVRPGETVLVPSASGGVASAAVQAARVAGARVIASVGAPDKIAGVQALGADSVFCYRETPVGEAVRAATGGRGVDAVIDTHRRAAVRRPRGCDGARRQARDVRRACGRGGAARPRRSCSGEATGCSGSGSRAPRRSAPR